MLQQIIQGSMGVSDPALEDQVLQNALQLVINCLQYDFIGTNPDESAEDVGTIQLPLKWRPKVQDPSTMKIFFDMYRGCSRGTFTPKSGGATAGAASGGHDMVGAGGGMDMGMGMGASAMAGAGAGAGAGAAAGTGSTRGSIPVRPKRAAQALECLTLFISVRRSIFAKEETRVSFLLQIVSGVCEIMRDEIVRRRCVWWCGGRRGVLCTFLAPGAPLTCFAAHVACACGMRGSRGWRTGSAITSSAGCWAS